VNKLAQVPAHLKAELAAPGNSVSFDENVINANFRQVEQRVQADGAGITGQQSNMMVGDATQPALELDGLEKAVRGPSLRLMAFP